MKVSLVVASGAHQGKVIPITGPQFLIGRDVGCQLRPASQAVSKQHCGVFVRDGQIFIKDLGSTNGTLVNDVLIRASEVQVSNGASLKLGPLDFTLNVEIAEPKPDGTPLPGNTSEAAAALAAVTAASGVTPRAPQRDVTPSPIQPKKPMAPAAKDQSGLKETAAIKAGSSKEAAPLTASKEAAALKAAAAKPIAAATVKSSVPPSPAPRPEPVAEPSSETTISTSLTATNEDDDKMAAMLLGLEDNAGEVPEGSTVVEMPAVDLQGNPIPPQAKPDDKAKKAPVAQSREEMSSAASDLLRKMMRRPK